MLAAKLTRTVEEMRASMSNAEFMYWSMYYRRKAQRAELERLKAG